MKKTHIILLAIVIGMVPLADAHSQIGVGVVNWQISGSMGDQQKFVDELSYIGFGIEGHSYISRHFSLGLSFDWQVFDKQTSEPIQLPGGTLSGKQYRYVNSFPMLVNFRMYAGSVHDFRMFLGANVGAYYIMQRLQFGLATLENKDWFFGGGPEFGFMIPMQEMYFFTSARVNYAVRNLDDTEDPYMWWSAKIGIAYDRW